MSTSQTSKTKYFVSNIITGDTFPVVFHIEGEHEGRRRWHLYVPEELRDIFTRSFTKQHYGQFTEPNTQSYFKLLEKGRIKAFIQLYSMKQSYNHAILWAWGKELTNFEVAKITYARNKLVRSCD